MNQKKKIEKYNILPIGCSVFIGPVEKRALCGEISAINIRGNTITYEVVWWEGLNRKTDWFGEHEITYKPGLKKEQIGFTLEKGE